MSTARPSNRSHARSYLPGVTAPLRRAIRIAAPAKAPSLETLCAIEDVRTLAWSHGMTADTIDAITTVRLLTATHGRSI